MSSATIPNPPFNRWIILIGKGLSASKSLNVRKIPRNGINFLPEKKYDNAGIALVLAKITQPM